MQHANDFVLVFPPQRQTGVRTFNDRLNQHANRLVGVQHDDITAVSHHVLDPDIAKVEDAAQHLALLFSVGVRALMELDHAAQFLFTFLVAEAGGDAHTEQAQNTAHHMRGDPVDRPQHPDQRADRRGHRQGGPFGAIDGIGLGQDFGEDDHQNGHHHGRVNHPGLAEQANQNAGGQHRCQNIGDIIANQDRPNEGARVVAQVFHRSRPGVAAARQLVDARPRRRGQRGFRTRQKRRQQKQQKNAAGGDRHLDRQVGGPGPQVVGHGALSKAAANTSITASRLIASDNMASPMAVARTKVMRPAATFLSFNM